MTRAFFSSKSSKKPTQSAHSKTDSQLVLRCQNNERKAQRELYELYKDWVFNVAYRMANNRQEAEDISQVVFMRVFKNLSSFRGDAALSSWIYRIAVNVCINHFRKTQKRSQHTALQDTDLKDMKSIEPPFNLKPYLEKAIRDLPEGYRMVFVLHDIEGYNHKEIGNLMKISDGTSKSQLHKARKELKQTLEPYLIIHHKMNR
ncbi:MAG: RNA polymerase sigma factor [bacterium]